MGEGDPLIRAAAADDLARLLALDRSVRAGADQPAHAADWLDPDAAERFGGWIERGECFLALVGGELAAYGVLHHHFFHSGFIDMIIVSAAHRRRGIGRSMVRFLAERCTSEKVWISTNLSNTRMQGLIASEGFQMAGFIEGLDPGDPELIFSKPAPGGGAVAGRPPEGGLPPPPRASR